MGSDIYQRTRRDNDGKVLLSVGKATTGKDLFNKRVKQNKRI